MFPAVCEYYTQRQENGSARPEAKTQWLVDGSFCSKQRLKDSGFGSIGAEIGGSNPQVAVAVVCVERDREKGEKEWRERVERARERHGFCSKQRLKNAGFGKKTAPEVTDW